MPADKDLVDHTRIDATCWEDSRYAYTKHIYYGWRKEALEQHVWRREYKPIGMGGFGDVYREECIEGPRKAAVRAVKHIKKPTASQRAPSINFGRELEAIARFSEPKYEPFFVRSEGWYDAGDTPPSVCQTALPENEVKLVIGQTLRGVAHMHRAGYAHRDLKPQNLLVVHEGPAWRIKIADFGLSKFCTQGISSLRSTAGTSGYMAPEVLGHQVQGDVGIEYPDILQNGKKPSYTNAVDLWAVGVICFLLLAGELPFPAHDYYFLAQYVQGKVSFPAEKVQVHDISASAVDLVQLLLKPRPSSRPSAESSLQHEWLEDRQDDLVSARQDAHSSAAASELPSRSNNNVPSSSFSASWNTTFGQDQTMTSRRHRWSFFGLNSRGETEPSRPPQSRLPDKEKKMDERAAVGDTARNLHAVDSGDDLADTALPGKTAIGDTRHGAYDTKPASIEERPLRLRGRDARNLKTGGRWVHFARMELSPYGTALAIGTDHKGKGDEVILHDVAKRKTVSTIQEKHSLLLFRPDGKQLVLYMETPSLSSFKFYDAGTGHLIRTIESENQYFATVSIAFLPDGRLTQVVCRRLQTGTDDLQVITRGKDLETIERTAPLALPRPIITHRKFLHSQDGKLLALWLDEDSTHRNSELYIWDTTTFKLCYRMEKVCSAIALSPDNKMVAVVAQGESRRRQILQLVDIGTSTTARHISLVKYRSADVMSIDFSPGGVHVAVLVCYDNNSIATSWVFCYNAKSGAKTSENALQGGWLDDDCLNDLRFSQNGKFLAVLSERNVGLYDVLS